MISLEANEAISLHCIMCFARFDKLSDRFCQRCQMSSRYYMLTSHYLICVVVTMQRKWKSSSRFNSQDLTLVRTRSQPIYRYMKCDKISLASDIISHGSCICSTTPVGLVLGGNTLRIIPLNVTRRKRIPSGPSLSGDRDISTSNIGMPSTRDNCANYENWPKRKMSSPWENTLDVVLCIHKR